MRSIPASSWAWPASPAAAEEDSSEFEYATLEWVDWFNRRRLLGPLGYVPPVEFEEAYHRSREAPAMVTGLQ